MSILIDVAAEFTGKKAFKQAETATDKLTKSAKSLGKTLGISLGTAAILGYAKASVKAAADDQKAQKQLALALKNVGLERDATNAESYIQRLQSEFGVVDDKLRPAYQKLAIATRSTTETQKLLNLSLDISAATGKDLESVTAALSKAYLGSNTALSKLGIGISKADLKTKSFDDITNKLADTFKGAAATSAATFAGSMAKLGVASQNVKEIIGTGIIDALKTLSNDDSVSNLAKDMESLALYTADVIRGFGLMATALQKIPGISGFDVGMIPILGTYIKVLQEAGAKARRIAEVSGQKNPIQSGSYLATQSKITALTKEQAAAQAKILKDKKLTAALDKANLALNKGTDVFNLEAIQQNAALINQTEQLGKATNAAQILAITNDVARLNTLRSIRELQEAIDSKDPARIEAATAKLNKNIEILGNLQNQKYKLTEIDDLLKTMMPKDLINIGNLNNAFYILDQISRMTLPTVSTSTGQTPGVTYNPTQNADRNYDLNNPLAVYVTNLPSTASGTVQGAGLTYNPTQNQDRNYSTFVININSVVGDPNAIAETLDAYLQGAVDRGTLRLR